MFLSIACSADTDEARWAAILKHAKVSGKKAIPTIKPVFKHSNWLLRDAALKAAAAIGARELRPQIEDCLKDEALAIRTTAVDIIGQLNLYESAPKLLEALEDPRNYHKGKALWITKHILEVIKDFHYLRAAPTLASILGQKKNDKDLQLQLISTLESLTHRSFRGKDIQEQVYLWKRNTLSELTF